MATARLLESRCTGSVNDPICTTAPGPPSFESIRGEHIFCHEIIYVKPSNYFELISILKCIIIESKRTLNV